MMRSLLPIAVLGLLLAAPLAFAQEEQPPANESEQAWVEDCPPDMMCAMETPEDENATYSGDCGGEVCAYEPPDGAGDGSTCMDGRQANETCRDDVQYLDGPARGPTDGSCEACAGGDAADTETASRDEKTVPGAGVAFGILAAAVAMVLLLAGRR